MKTIKLSMIITVSDEAVDDLKKVEHHVESLLDLDSWPEIESVHSVNVSPVDASDNVSEQRDLLRRIIEMNQDGRSVEETIHWCLFVGFQPDDLVLHYGFEKEDVDEALETYNA